jgi:hypothetical protein
LKPEIMIVRVRLGRGAVRSGRAGKNSRIARVTAYLLTLTSISCAAFGIWRLGDDLGWTGKFVFTSGTVSHWQVWVGSAMLAQYIAWRLTLHARKADMPAEDGEPEHPHVSVPSKV